ncbi:D-2-hydroxyacid dehydrogenase [Microbacterium immunditiarum]|uniref:Phosphoglycerate dehydrogenase-like enzyme n=1 Tax=Microbacterium immunditiarum TaxID=337480 RepID=A0A7Y9KJF4_9MICO|nr:D-2-hydroxyacid dehydrogenase [Microbacterium immunditiarum]NYE18083.1 phosphoglycerate dehydrogenase-like enzyme [Microbacterium immunditiarum]
MDRRPRVVLSRYLPDRLITRITNSCPWADIIAEPNAMLPPTGRVGLLYASSDRAWELDSDPELSELAWRRLLPDTDVLFDLHPSAVDLLPADGRIAFIQSLAAGAGELLHDERVHRAGIPICTARGVHDDGLADFTLAAILAHAKRLGELEQNKRRRSWVESEGRRLRGTTMLVVGLGSIGKAIARRATAFGIVVRGVQRRPRACDEVESTHSLDELDGLLGDADWVVDVLPASPDTRWIFDSERFSRFRTGAYFVNIGRGSTVDELALCRALASGVLGGAALDAYEEEPLGPSSPLWDAPNLVISPHSSALIPGSVDRIVDLFIDNLRRHHEGRPLRNLASPLGHANLSEEPSHG